MSQTSWSLVIGREARSYDPLHARAIIRQLYIPLREDPRAVTETFILAPIGDEDSEDRRICERFLELGWIERSHDIAMNTRPDPVTYRPTRELFRWARSAFDDQLWLEQLPAFAAVLNGS